MFEEETLERIVFIHPVESVTATKKQLLSKAIQGSLWNFAEAWLERSQLFPSAHPVDICISWGKNAAFTLTGASSL